MTNRPTTHPLTILVFQEMAYGPYSQFITTRHYQLIIRDLFRKPTTILPRIFNFIVLGSDLVTIQLYSYNLLGIKPVDTITPPNIYNCNSLLAAAKSGSFAKFKWMFENYQYISLIYSKKDIEDSSIFTNPESLQYFICDVIRETTRTNQDVQLGTQQILEWLLFSKNTRDDKTLQEWVVNLGYYNTRDKVDYKEVYVSCISCYYWNLAQQILESGLIPPGDIQTGRDIIQPSFQAGMIARNRGFLDFIIDVDSRNGEWLGQGRTNNFRELTTIIRGWDDRVSATDDDGSKTRNELLLWYLQTYFNKYSQPSLTNEELGLVYDFIIDISGYITPELYSSVLTSYFSAATGTKKYKLLAKTRLVAALGKSNLPMAKLLLSEILYNTEQTECDDWVVHIPGNTLVEICGNRTPMKDLAVLNWLWERRENFMIDWSVLISNSSARTWISKYYSPDLPSPFPIGKWIWDNICISTGARFEFAELLTNDESCSRHKSLEIMELCANHRHYSELVSTAWLRAIKCHNVDICEFLLSRYPVMILGLALPKEQYFRGLFTNPGFSCWMIEKFPSECARISAELAYELITQQYGYYRLVPSKLAELIALFPLDGNIGVQGDYMFHYACRTSESVCEWQQVLYKFCMMEPDKYSVVLDPEQPNDLGRAQFLLNAQYATRYVSNIELCPICQNADSALITGCGHQFCVRCITQWFQQKQDIYQSQNQSQKNCPYCRTLNPGLYKINLAVSC
jgi:hypothetical protein